MKPPTVNDACTPKEKTSGVAGIISAAEPADSPGIITGVYTETEWNYCVHSNTVTIADGCQISPSRVPMPQLLPLTPSWDP